MFVRIAVLLVTALAACVGSAIAWGPNRIPEVLGPERVTLVPGGAALSVREVTALLFKADGSRWIDQSLRTLRGLDLSGLDFKSAKLSGADLFGADLSQADLSGVNLDGAILSGGKGFEAVRGRDSPRNLDRAVH